MPNARRERMEIYKDALNPKRFVHYTSAEAALKIINTKRIWMRNATCMSDYREVQHGFDILNSFFKDQTKKQTFFDALDGCSPGCAQEALTLFNGWLQDVHLNTYVTSISRHEDDEDKIGRLSMWRAFGGSVGRVGIVLRVPQFSAASLALNIMFSPVAYMTEPEVHSELETVVRNILENSEYLKAIDRQFVTNVVFVMFVAGVICLKHHGFREEREWRAIYSPNRSKSPLMKPTTVTYGGVPQIIYELPLDAKISPALSELDASVIFDRLIIGPSPYPWAMYTAFVAALNEAGVSNAGERVFVSDIPIR